MALEREGGQGGAPDIEGLLAKQRLAEKEKQELTGKIDNQTEELKFIKGLICDPATGRCWLPTKTELAKATQPIMDEVKRQKEILDTVQQKIGDALKPKKPRGVLGSSHQSVEELQECDECQTELVEKYLGPGGLKKAAKKISEHPEACKDLTANECKCLLTGICEVLTPEKRKEIEASGLKISKRGEKGEGSYSFLLKNK